MGKKVVLNRFHEAMVVIGMIVMTMAIIIQSVFRPTGQVFNFVHYIALGAIMLLMILKIILSIKAVCRDRMPCLIVNLVAMAMLIVLFLGIYILKNFERTTAATVGYYVSLAVYVGTSLCLL